MGWLKRLFGAEQEAERGSILVLGALSLVGVLGLTGLAVEMGNGYTAKVRNQRVADVAALGAAVAYQASSQSLAVAQQTATDIAAANGSVTGSGTTVTVAQATVNSQAAIQVSVQTTVPIRLANIISQGAGSYLVNNTAYAALTGNNTAACIVALSSSGNTNGVSATGGASINANGCAVNSNSTIASDNSSAKITAKQVVGRSIADAAAAYNQNAITTNPTANNIQARANAATDPIKSNTDAQTALCYVNKLTGYNDPDYQGGNKSCTSQIVPVTTYTSLSVVDWNTGYNPRANSVFDSYQTSDYSCNYVIPFGNYDIRTLTVNGGCSISFATGSTLKFQTINMNGSSMSIGDGLLIVTGTFSVNANNIVTVGNGSHSFGTLSIGGGKYLRVGNGNFNVGSKISLSGGAWLKVDIAAGNIVVIGNDGQSTPSSIDVGGGSQLCFTSDCSTATAAAGTFSANGAVNNAGGGSTIVFPRSAIHVINGNLALAAAASFGSGLYIIKGDWTNGTGCGGCVMAGVDVTFALGGSFNFAGGTFFDLAAPSAAGGYGIQDLLILTKSSTATAISAGSAGKAGGVIYAPNSDFSSSGGSAISSNGGQCMMLIANTVAVSQSGTINTKNCASQSTSATGTVSLLQ